MSELAELGEISKETMEEYMANQRRKRQAAGPGARPTPPPKTPDAHARWKQQQETDAAERRFRSHGEHLDFEEARADQQARNATPQGRATGRGGPVDASQLPKGDHRTAAHGMTNEQWRQHMAGTHAQGNAATHAAGGQPTGAAGAAEVDRIRATRAADQASEAAHAASGSKHAMPVPEHAATAVKEGAGKYKPAFQLPKYTKRGAAAGLGALTAGAAAMHAKRARDAAG